MGQIGIVAEKYRARGHRVRVLSRTRIEVHDGETGYTYRVTARGRAVVGAELAAEVAAKLGDPHSISRN